MQIKFGTDGWRAIIADTFTYQNLETVSRATAQWLLDTYPSTGSGQAPSVVLGHDTRFGGRAFAEHSARVFASPGVRVILAETFASTPSISWAVLGYGCSAGIVITASHNPPSYNGFKIKAHYGGPASPDMIDEVERRVDAAAGGAALRSFADLKGKGLIEERDVVADYLDVLRGRLDIEAIRQRGLKIAHDAMFGAGQGLVSRLVGNERVVPLHHDQNPGMHGQAPEPIERNLAGLAAAVTANGCALGIANDGDADRVGMYDETGAFVDSHRLLCLLVKYLHEERGLSGTVVKTFSTTHLLDKMGAKYGLPVETTKIGFKYIGSKIVEGDVLVGGEESGGMAVKGHIPERDGTYIGLLVVEAMVKRGKKLSELVEELYEEFGPHYNVRADVHTTNDKKEAVLKRLRGSGLETVDGQAVTKVDSMDGFKLFTEGGRLLVRASGTEPVLRVYAEADSMERAEAMIRDARAQLGVADETH